MISPTASAELATRLMEWRHCEEPLRNEILTAQRAIQARRKSKIDKIDKP